MKRLHALCAKLKAQGQAWSNEGAPLQAEKNAKNIVRELEDAKLAGIDYPVSSLINLRQVSSPTCARLPHSHAVLPNA